MYISNIWSFTTSTLMMAAEEISETLVSNSTSTQQITQEDFSTFIHREGLKS
jgi:hypothetical protein